MPGPVSSLITAVLALAAVLALIGIAAAAARRSGVAVRLGTRRGGGASTSRLTLEASLALDPRRRLHLLRCADRDVLLLTGGPQDLLLGWLPPPAPPATPPPPRPDA